MSRRPQWPIALTIAGSDSGGGAGIQADLKTFAALRVHGTSAITCVTAQNPRGVRSVQACRPGFVRDQLEIVFAELKPAAVKTGMLFSTPIIHMVAEFFRRGNRPPLVVDPVMVATSGAPLLQPSARRALRGELLPLATLVTPNLHEAEILLGETIASVQDLRAAARALQAQHGCAALVKGGHLLELSEAVDFYCDGQTELMLSAPFVRGVSTHGTGCTYSAAIAAYLARGCALTRAVALAKDFITQAIARSVEAGGHSVLNPFGQSSARG
jgi:hydroxymethylpyrimidine/phosphomethylpyrimidine kinase